MKLLLLWLLPLLSYFPAAGPAMVRVTFSPLTKAAYLTARKTAVSTKPVMTFPVKKMRGRIVIPTAKGPKVFQDNDADEENPDWEKYNYLRYWPQFESHLILDLFLNKKSCVFPAIFRAKNGSCSKNPRIMA